MADDKPKPKPKRIRKTAGRTPDQPKRGPLPWEPTDPERRLIEHFVSQGYTQEQIAALIGKTVDTLTKHCREELDLGKLRVCAKVGGKLFQKAMGGDTAAIIWFEKTRSGMKETSHHEIDAKFSLGLTSFYSGSPQRNVDDPSTSE
jgi:hypothetical protein